VSSRTEAHCHTRCADSIKVGGSHKPYREDRMVWAWDRRAGGLVRIQPGTAKTLRTRCKAGDLVCPMADCSSPALNTRRGYENRWGTFVADGFKHCVRPTPDHKPESFHHVQGKLLVADWLTSVGCIDVEVERYDTQAHRTPDISAISPTGTRLAIEVQYSDLLVSTWLERDADLRHAGMKPIWMWGHSRLELATEATSSRPTALQHLLLANGGRLWWINPDASMFGLPSVFRPGVGRTGGPDRTVTPESGDSRVDVEWFPTEEFGVSADILHPRPSELDVALDELRDELHFRIAVGLSSLNQRLTPPTPRPVPARPPSSRSQRKSQKPFITPPPRPDPPDPVVFRKIIPLWDDLADAGLEQVVGSRLDGDMAVFTNSGAWHAYVLHRLLVGRAAGARIRVSEIVALVHRSYACEPQHVSDAVSDLLRCAASTGRISVAHGVVTVHEPVAKRAEG
jgi:hypothetical protein